MKRFLLFVLCLVIGACTQRTDYPVLIPSVSEVEYGRKSFSLPETAGIYTDSGLATAGEYLQESFADRVHFCAVASEEAAVRLLMDQRIEGIDAYQLSVTHAKVEIRCNSYGGAVTAIATLRQLAVAGSVPCCHIEDRARFAWRGFMLDVSRHFFTKEEVMRLLDYMALYKFNKFHWHLTDDQGWRIELDAYPELTAQGAWRKPNNHDEECMQLARQQDDSTYLLPEDRHMTLRGDRLYGGYYTKADIREVVAYAAKRGIDVVPEVDMPGHSQRAIAVYPTLSCFDKASWGTVFSAPLCLGKDRTIEFCKNVYREIFELFPFQYVHIGGDEVEKDNWERCPRCQSRIRDLKLKDEKELQSWFIKEMTDFFEAHGKKLIGWDEIEEGGLQNNQTVMWWRSWSDRGFRNAIAAGNETIISNNEYFYLNQAENRGSLRKVYEFDIDGLFEGPIPASVKGVQAHLWAETIPTFEKCCFQLFPRLLAVSEQAWRRPSGDFEEFERRAFAHLEVIFDADSLNYRIPDLKGFCDRNVFVGQTEIKLTAPLQNTEIYYTTDGTIPTQASNRYADGIVVTEDTTLKVRCYTPAGYAGEIVTLSYVATDYLPAVEAKPSREGLQVDWHDFRGDTCAKIDSATFLGRYVVPTVAIPKEASGNIGLIFNGYIEVPADGIYSFYLESDDGSVLDIDGVRVIDNDGPHSRLERSGQVALAKGIHRLSARYFDYNGGMLKFGTIDSAGRRKPLPASWRLLHE